MSNGKTTSGSASTRLGKSLGALLLSNKLEKGEELARGLAALAKANDVPYVSYSLDGYTVTVETAHVERAHSDIG